MRKFIALFISLILVMSSSVPVFAAENNRELNYVKECVESHIKKARYTPVLQVSVSDAIKMYNLAGDKIYNIYFVFDGDNIIGKILVSNEPNGFYSYFTFCEYEILQDAYLQKKLVGIYATSNCFFVWVEGEAVILENPDNLQINVDTYQLSAYANIEKKENISMSKESRSVYYFLDVKHVKNETVDNKGICWAATVAAKVNYQTGSNFSARNIYDAYWNSTYPEIHDSSKSENWYKDSAKIYGLTLNYQSRLLPKSGATYALSNNKPIILWINSPIGKVAHSVILCGLDEDATGWEFVIRDPNLNSFVYVTMPTNIFDQPSGFKYSPSGTLYTEVLASMY